MNKQQHINQRKQIESSNMTNKALAVALPVVTLVVLGGANLGDVLPQIIKFFVG